MRPGWTEVALGEVLNVRTDTCQIHPDTEYREVTVSLWGKGVRLRRKVFGAGIAAPFRNVAREGDFIISKIDARNGAFGFIPNELDGAVVTNDFPLFSVRAEKLSPRWLYWISQSPFFTELCKAASAGTTNRVRLDETKFAGLAVPLPPLAEQQRIAARLDAIETRLARVRQLRDEAKAERDALTTSLHLAMSAERLMSFDRLLSLREEGCPVVPDGSYPQVGIRSFGLGLFKKPAVAGTATTYRTFNVLRPGMFVMSQVKGWEGAIGVCREEFDGWFVSPEYRTFACNESECASAYLSHLVATPWFQNQLASATRGVGARRERVRPEMLLNLEIPFPTLTKQEEALRVLERLTQSNDLGKSSVVSEAALLQSLLDQVFSS